MKQCSKCLQIKSNSEYYKHSTNKDGLRGDCKQCHLAHTRKHYSDNIEKERERSKKKAAKERLENPDKVNERNRKHMVNSYINNPDKYKMRSANWKKENPEKVNAWSRKRKALKQQNATYDISESFLKRLYDSPCVSCGSRKNITQDHVIPIARGGAHSEGNLQPLCQSCNSSKKDKLWIEWIHAK